MTLRNFDTVLDEQGVTRLQRVADVVNVVEEVRVYRPPVEHRDDLAVPEGQWDWRALRDYVAHQIEMRHGPFPRNEVKEAGIFKAFMSRWGDKAAAIARSAFDDHNGRWAGAPISLNRFCRASDPYFASVLADRL